mmetsp:Transcript_58695/g.172234  ORF Transcript_58695/g.172234 Transcript_58695/m.172234 type:complete len:200 (-) Transcript_58695:185-784(-)
MLLAADPCWAARRPVPRQPLQAPEGLVDHTQHLALRRQRVVQAQHHGARGVRQLRRQGRVAVLLRAAVHPRAAVDVEQARRVAVGPLRHPHDVDATPPALVVVAVIVAQPLLHIALDVVLRDATVQALVKAALGILDQLRAALSGDGRHDTPPPVAQRLFRRRSPRRRPAPRGDGGVLLPWLRALRQGRRGGGGQQRPA